MVKTIYLKTKTTTCPKIITTLAIIIIVQIENSKIVISFRANHISKSFTKKRPTRTPKTLPKSLKMYLIVRTRSKSNTYKYKF